MHPLLHSGRDRPRWLRCILLTMAVSGSLAACTGVADDCPHTDGERVDHVVVVELSASERAPDLFDHRIDRIGQHALQAADCQARFMVIGMDGGLPVTLYDDRFRTDLNTERARDNQVPKLVEQTMGTVRSTLAEQATGPVPAHSDPGAAFLALADLVARLDPDETIDALIVADGVTMTPSINLNRRLSDDELAELTERVAPAVDLARKVTIDWPDIGHTADPTSPPSDWLVQLRHLWHQVCLDRNASTCTVTTL